MQQIQSRISPTMYLWAIGALILLSNIFIALQFYSLQQQQAQINQIQASVLDNFQQAISLASSKTEGAAQEVIGDESVLQAGYQFSLALQEQHSLISEIEDEDLLKSSAALKSAWKDFQRSITVGEAEAKQAFLTANSQFLLAYSQFSTQIEHKYTTLLIAVVLVSVFTVLVMLIGYLKVLKPLLSLQTASTGLAEGHMSALVILENSIVGSIARQLTVVQQKFDRIGVFVQKLGEGVLDYTPDSFTSENGKEDSIIQSLLNTQTILRQNEAATHQRNWAAEGIAQLEELLRQENKDLKKLSDSVISFVVNYSKANQGAIFLVNEENSKPVLELQGCYAYGRLKHIGKTIIPGQDLVGQAYLERDIIYLTDVPDQYTQITSGLGEATPSAVILVPLKIEEQIVGVLEMASFNQIEPYQRDFLLKAAQSIASTVLNVRVNITTTQLLERSQQQTEELRAQEEEVRQNMEELSATQEEMARMTKEMESQLSAINDTMATIEFDLEGNILAANSNFLQLMGYELEAIRGKHHRTFVDPTEAGSAAYQEFWTRLAAGHKETGEFKRITRKGQEVYIRGIYSPIIDQNGKPKKILKLAYDITDSKVNELEVQGLMSAIDGSIASIEFSPDGNILNANENFLQVMGYTLAEIRGKHHRMFVEQEERRSDDYAEFWKEIGRGEHKSGEFKRVDSSGNAVYIKGIYNPVLNQAGKVVKVIKLAYDITQSKLMEMEIQQQLEQTQAQEEELRQNMEELSATQEEMSRINREIESQIQSINKTMATIEFDTSGNILAANDNFLELMGYSFEEIASKHHQIFMHETDAQSAEYKKFWQDLGAGKEMVGEFKRKTKSNQSVYIKGMYNPVCNHQGEVVKITKLAYDITSLKVEAS